MADRQTAVAAVGSSLNKPAIVQNAQGFGTMALNNEFQRGNMEVDSMFGYQHSTLQSQHSIGSIHRNTLYSASFRQKRHNIYEEMALPDGYLYGYFSQVGNQKCFIHTQQGCCDLMLKYN